MRRRDDAEMRGRRSATARSVRRNRVLALAILAILALAAVAPAGQASDAAKSERSAQRAMQAAERAARREAVRMQREAARNARKGVKADKQAQRQAKAQQRQEIRLAGLISPHAVVELQCRKIVVKYRGFNSVPGNPNVVTQKVIFKQRPGPLPTYVLPSSTFSFEGEEGTSEIPIAAPLGDSGVGVRARFDTNGVKGGFNIHGPLTCGPIPQFSLETLQSVGGPFTTSPLPGAVGQTVTYETLATNTGNTPLSFTGFSDPGCDGMLAGGTAAVVGPRSSVTFVCTHALTNADRAAGFFANAASVTGTPEAGQGEPVTQVSSGVLVTPIAAGEEKAKPPAGGSKEKEVTTAAAPAAAGPGTAKTGVLGFSSAAVPSLLGPARCVRGNFTVSVKSAGVASVIFYIDGRKLARRTVHSAQRGLISIHVNGAKLKAGTHRLTATITMVPGSSTTKAVVASRARVVHRCRVVAKPALKH